MNILMKSLSSFVSLFIIQYDVHITATFSVLWEKMPKKQPPIKQWTSTNEIHVQKMVLIFKPAMRSVIRSELKVQAYCLWKIHVL